MTIGSIVFSQKCVIIMQIALILTQWIFTIMLCVEIRAWALISHTFTGHNFVGVFNFNVIKESLQTAGYILKFW